MEFANITNRYDEAYSFVSLMKRSAVVVRYLVFCFAAALGMLGFYLLFSDHGFLGVAPGAFALIGAVFAVVIGQFYYLLFAAFSQLLMAVLDTAVYSSKR